MWPKVGDIFVYDNDRSPHHSHLSGRVCIVIEVKEKDHLKYKILIDDTAFWTMIGCMREIK